MMKCQFNNKRVKHKGDNTAKQENRGEERGKDNNK